MVRARAENTVCPSPDPSGSALSRQGLPLIHSLFPASMPHRRALETLPRGARRLRQSTAKCVLRASHPHSAQAAKPIRPPQPDRLAIPQWRQYTTLPSKVKSTREVSSHASGCAQPLPDHSLARKHPPATAPEKSVQSQGTNRQAPMPCLTRPQKGLGPLSGITRSHVHFWLLAFSRLPDIRILRILPIPTSRLAAPRRLSRPLAPGGATASPVSDAPLGRPRLLASSPAPVTSRHALARGGRCPSPAIPLTPTGVRGTIWVRGADARLFWPRRN
jgi:hypothetical protein